MKKEYYDKNKAKIITNMLKTTNIDKLYWPLIVETVLRRQYRFNLTEEEFLRDVNSIKENLNEITVEKVDSKNNLATYYVKKKKIVINEDVLRVKDVLPLEIYRVLNHELMHVMNYIKIDEEVFDDRSIPGLEIRFTNGQAIVLYGGQELFTECECDYTSANLEPSKNTMLTTTTGYRNISFYFDVIASAFGVTKSELLSAYAKGKNQLNSLLNKSLNMEEYLEDDVDLFKHMILNISLIDQENFRTDPNNIGHNNMIMHFAEQVMNKRISSMQINDMDSFEEQFDRLVLNQTIIKAVYNFYSGVFSNASKENSNDMSEKYAENSFGILDLKIRCFDEILNNSEIIDKNSLINRIKTLDTKEDIYELLKKENIVIDFTKEIKPSQKAVDEHNDDYCFHGEKFDNESIIKYIGRHRNQMLYGKQNVFKRLKAWFKYELLKFEHELLGEYSTTNGKKHLTPEKPNIESKRNGTEPTEQLQSWDLENWSKKTIDGEPIITITSTEVTKDGETPYEYRDNEIRD